jgi:lysophospholipase L1-like esterase
MSNAELDVNSSYCGSTVQDNAAKGKPSFISRYADLRNPDIILINGGTNDSWSYRLPVGTLNFDLSLEELDTYQFAQAYDKLIRLLQREYPSAKIFLILGDCLRDFPTYTKVITDLAAHYNLKTAQITFADRTTMTYQRTGTSDVNVHPNIAGMKEMANQIWNQLKNDL